MKKKDASKIKLGQNKDGLKRKPRLICLNEKCKLVLRPGKITQKGICACDKKFIIQEYVCPNCRRNYYLEFCTLLKNQTDEQLQAQLTWVICKVNPLTKKGVERLFKKYPPQFDKAKKPKT